MVSKQNIILLTLAVLLAFAPLVFNKDAEFAGTDDQAQEVIAEVNPDYKPWFQTIWEPPSGEVESFLFALQAAIGAGFIGYYFGYKRGVQSAGSHENTAKTLERNSATARFGLRGN